MFKASNILHFLFLFQVNDLNSALTNFKKEVAEKDSKLVDYQKQLQSLTGKEDELFKQIADYKNKNNVSTMI